MGIKLKIKIKKKYYKFILIPSNRTNSCEGLKINFVINAYKITVAITAIAIIGFTIITNIVPYINVNII